MVVGNCASICATMAEGGGDMSTTMASDGSSSASNWLESMSAFMKWLSRCFMRARMSSAEPFR